SKDKDVLKDGIGRCGGAFRLAYCKRSHDIDSVTGKDEVSHIQVTQSQEISPFSGRDQWGYAGAFVRRIGQIRLNDLGAFRDRSYSDFAGRAGHGLRQDFYSEGTWLDVVLRDFLGS